MAVKRKSKKSAEPASTYTNTKLSLPSEWPGAFGIYKYSKLAIIPNLTPIVLIYAGNAIIGYILGYFKTIGSLIDLFVGLAALIAITKLNLGSARGKLMNITEAFSSIGSTYWQMIVLYILLSLSALSFLLLIIPGIIIMPRLFLAPFYLIDKNISAVEAYKASWSTTRNHAGMVWGIVGVSFLILLPTILAILTGKLLIAFLGGIITIYFGLMYLSVFALLYVYLEKHKKTSH